MTIEDYEFVLKELQQLIDDAKNLITRFEAENVDQSMSTEYHNLHELYQRAVKSQWSYPREMLDLIESETIDLGQLSMR